MPLRRCALVLGGTGMLAGCVDALVGDGWYVVMPSRHRPPAPHKALWVQADWSDPATLAERAGEALDAPADLLVAWVHGSFRNPVLQAVAPLLADNAPVVEVHGSASANPIVGCPEPVLPSHPTQQVVLGFLRHGGRTRWLTHRETVDGVLAAVHRALEGRLPAVHQVGEFRPWSALS
jgi:NAD(P)-dependent dehydrogenase (short-subunit alcohol dehydrogenase family)